MFDFILHYDFSYLLNAYSLVGIVVGVVLGILVGALPGLNATVGCALLLPLSFSMPPSAAVCMLVALFMGAMYGGSISAILLAIPGTPSAIATILDGSPIAKRGSAGQALGYSLYASTVGGLLGALVLIFLTRPLSAIAIRLADPELFLVGLVGIVSIASLGEENTLKTIISILMGLMIGVIGLDPILATNRYTFGNIYLSDGFSLIALLAGFYALSEVFTMSMGDMENQPKTKTRSLNCTISREEFRNILPVSIKSGIIGVIFGIIPGLGGGPATFYCYTQARRGDKEPETFGKGNPRGLAAAESSNNAVVGGGLVPLLSLGIPGTPAIAVISGALMMQGITPGPNLMSANPNLVYTVYWGILLAVAAMFIFGRYATSLFARILLCPNYVLIAVICVLLLIGAHAGRYFNMDIWTCIGAGVLGFFMSRLKFSLTAFTIAFVLSDLIEIRFRRALMLGNGSPVVFFTRPFCIALWVLLAWMVYTAVRDYRRGVAKGFTEEDLKTRESE